MRTEFAGSILAIRAIEDCIRSTNKYTKGVFRRKVEHPIQGAEFPSRVITEYYEVYPDMELSWDMPASDAWAWVWGDTPHVDVWFHYNYNKNSARMEVGGNNGVVEMLKGGVPGLAEAMEKVRMNGNSRRR